MMHSDGSGSDSGKDNGTEAINKDTSHVLALATHGI
jgi:hypothetical protein